MRQGNGGPRIEQSNDVLAVVAGDRDKRIEDAEPAARRRSPRGAGVPSPVQGRGVGGWPRPVRHPTQRPGLLVKPSSPRMLAPSRRRRRRMACRIEALPGCGLVVRARQPGSRDTSGSKAADHRGRCAARKSAGRVNHAVHTGIIGCSFAVSRGDRLINARTLSGVTRRTSAST